MSILRRANDLSGRNFLCAITVLCAVGVAAYHNSFTGPFVFDDGPAITENPSIRLLWSLGEVLAPSLDGGLTVSGRPLVNLSLAINYALGGEAVAGYHVLNLIIHLLAGLTLFGVARRTLLLIPSPRLQENALLGGWFVAVLWLLHPLQTESVTYVVQRAESLMGLCYLLTLYGFIRGAEAGRPGRWFALSVLACLLGMASKEVMVSAPLMVLLYDRTFVAGSFRAAWQRRWRYYAALGSTWLLLAGLVASTAGRGGTAGFGTTVDPWHYLLTQCQAIVHYLRLVVWPDPLVFDYGTATVGGLGEVWMQALLLLALAVATGVALVRWPGWGFLGAWFFLILAPSSSVVPVASQTMAEHRMYLPLVAALGLGVVALYGWLGRRAWVVCAALAFVAGGLTVRRNAIYRSDTALWTDTVAKRPLNGRAHNNLGKAVFAAGRPEEAVGHYEAAIRLQPAVPEPHNNLALALAKLNRPAEAIARYEEALRLQPGYAEAHNNLGNVLLAVGRLDDANRHYEEALRLRPGWAEAHSNLANLRLEQGRPAEAIRHGEEAVRLDSAYPDARYNLGNALAQTGDLASAVKHYEAALRLRPDYAEAANNLGNVLAESGRLPEAILRYEEAVRLRAGYIDPRRNLVVVLAHLGRNREALSHCRELVRLTPDDPAARAELARLQALVRP